MSDYPIGARWECIDKGKRYFVYLQRREKYFEVWISGWTYIDDSGSKSDWYTSYESAKKGIYLDGSGLRLKRVKGE